MRFPAGYEFVKLLRRTKKPFQDNWNNEDPAQPRVPSLTPKQVREIVRLGGNYGVRLRACDLIIDVDPRNGGSIEKLPFDTSAFPIVLTPSGGCHIYTTLPAGFDYRQIHHSTKEFGTGFEFKVKGSQVVGPGCIHPDWLEGPKYAWDDIFAIPMPESGAPEIPAEFLTRILKDGSAADGSDDAFMSSVQLGAALARLDVEKFAAHDEWFALMCACHDATGGAGGDEFVNWSTADVAFADHAEMIRIRWASLKSGQSGNAGRGTLLHILIENGITDFEFERGSEDFAGLVEENKKFNIAIGPGNLPSIRISGGSLPSNVRDAEKALGAMTIYKPDSGVYQRGGFLIRIARYPGTFEVADEFGIHRANGALQILGAGVSIVRMHLTEAAQWLTYSQREKEWRVIDCPADISMTLSEAAGMWPTIPALGGITESPTLRPDGSLLDQPGYDSRSGIFFDSQIQFSAIPDKPTFEQSSAALDELLSLLAGFPFTSDASRSVALAMLLTPFARHAVRAAPMFLVSAPKMGSGKTLLSNLPNYLVAGKESSLFSQADNPEEDKKRMLALLLEGSLVTVIDNVDRPLKSDALCTALTEVSIKDRILGSTKVITAPTKTVWIATGNNVRVDGDLTSRCLLCSVDAKMERPEERTFNVNLHEFVPRNRGRFAAAALTLLRGYIASGERVQCTTYGRFEQWSRFVREPLLWMGLADPCDTRSAVESDDPIRVNLGNLLAAWNRIYGAEPVTAHKALLDVQSDLENQYEDLRLAVQAVAMDRGRLNAGRLMHFIAHYESRIEGSLTFKKAGKDQYNSPLWVSR